MSNHAEDSSIVTGSPVARLARDALIHAARKLGYDDGLTAPGPFTDATPQAVYDRVVELQQAGDLTTIDKEFGPAHDQMVYPDGDKQSSWLWPRLGVTELLIEEADPSGDTHTVILSHYIHAYRAAWHAEVMQIATRRIGSRP